MLHKFETYIDAYGNETNSYYAICIDCGCYEWAEDEYLTCEDYYNFVVTKEVLES